MHDHPRNAPGIGQAVTSEALTQGIAHHEGASYGFDTFMIADGILSANTPTEAPTSDNEAFKTPKQLTPSSSVR